MRAIAHDLHIDLIPTTNIQFRQAHLHGQVGTINPLLDLIVPDPHPLQIRRVIRLHIHILPDAQSQQPGSPIPPILVGGFATEGVVGWEGDASLRDELFLGLEVDGGVREELDREGVGGVQVDGGDAPLAEHVVRGEEGSAV